MKIAILGGGLTGLTAAYYLAKNGHQVTVFEKENFLGGMTSGFKEKNWDWFLEKTIHHLFANDDDFLNFAKEIGFDKIFFKKPETASLYSISKIKNQKSKIHIKNQKFSIYPLDTPFDLLKFPLLSFSEKLRAGLVLAFLKLSPFLKFYEQQTAEEFLEKYLGKKGWNILFQELLRKKFGKYAGNILASFIWARIKKRTKRLGYIEGGFQAFVDFLEEKNKKMRVKIFKEAEIKTIEKIDNMLQIYSSKRPLERLSKEPYEAIISTLPTRVLIMIGERLFPKNYLSQLRKINYLHAVSLILETDQPILKKTYWLNVTAKEIPIMGIFQQTNFVDKKHYGGKHLCYLGWYVEEKDSLWRMTKEEILDFVKPYLKKIFNYQFSILNSYLFKIPFAQPIFDKDFLKNKPNFKTPVENFYIANLDMTYPYDRGTNFAVKIGKEVAKILLSEKTR